MDCQLKFWYSLFPCQTFAQLLILTQLRNMSHSWHDALILLLSVYIFSVRPSTSWQINVFCIIHINVLYLVIIADVNICTSYNSYNLEYTCIYYSAVAWPVLRYILQCSTVPPLFRSWHIHFHVHVPLCSLKMSPPVLRISRYYVDHVKKICS